MTREDKELPLKDLCARIPYGVKVKILDMDVLPYEPSDIGTLVGKEHFDDDLYTIRCKREGWILEINKDFIPYLRPMSSMTEDERLELVFILNVSYTDVGKYGIKFMLEHGFLGYDEMSKLLDWLNAHHFDYRGLIERGLAIEAPEGMYNF